jgi:peptidyl-prolyl cis-trans isomerase SurA
MPKAAPEKEAALNATLADIDARLTAGEDFTEIAGAFSQGPAAARGGDLGWWKLADIALPELAYGLSNMPAGERNRIRSEQGHHIVEMLEREGQRVHFRQIFLPLPIDDADRQAARDRARQAWKALQAGDDWATVVLTYSDDSPTREKGGRLPAIPEEQLDERYRDVVDLLEPGEYSGVFLGKHGYQILRLEGREAARPFEFEEIAEQLRADVLGRKRGEVIQNYILGLESEIIVNRHEIPSLERIAALAGGGSGQAP